MRKISLWILICGRSIMTVYYATKKVFQMHKEYLFWAIAGTYWWVLTKLSRFGNMSKLKKRNPKTSKASSWNRRVKKSFLSTSNPLSLRNPSSSNLTSMASKTTPGSKTSPVSLAAAPSWPTSWVQWAVISVKHPSY